MSGRAQRVAYQMLLVAQRLDRIEVGGSIGRVKNPKPMPTAEQTRKTGDCPAVGEIVSTFSHMASKSPATIPRMIPRRPPASENENGLGQKIAAGCRGYGRRSICGRRFPCAFGHAHQHNIH